MLFRNRADAGRQLAARLGAYAGRPDVTVLALPRGGVPVAFEAARALGASTMERTDWVFLTSATSHHCGLQMRVGTETPSASGRYVRIPAVH